LISLFCPFLSSLLLPSKRTLPLSIKELPAPKVKREGKLSKNNLSSPKTSRIGRNRGNGGNQRKRKTTYVADISELEIKERFGKEIENNFTSSLSGLSAAIEKAFAFHGEKIRFGSKRENEICWYGEAGYAKNHKTTQYFSWGIGNIKQERSGDEKSKKEKKIKFIALSKEELAKREKEQEQKRQVQEKLKEQNHLEASAKAQKFYESYSKVGNSKYLENKGIADIAKASDIRFKDGNLFIPVRDSTGKIWTGQIISGEGEKKFLKGGVKQGKFVMFGERGVQNVKEGKEHKKDENNKEHTENKEDKDKNNQSNKSNIILITEGFATGARLHRASKLPTVVCFDAGNIDHVLKELKADDKYKNKIFIIGADNDMWKDHNTGKEKAAEAAKKYGAMYILPKFEYKHRDTAPTDWNDLEKLEGRERTKENINKAISIAVSRKLERKDASANFKTQSQEKSQKFKKWEKDNKNNIVKFEHANKAKGQDVKHNRSQELKKIERQNSKVVVNSSNKSKGIEFEH